MPTYKLQGPDGKVYTVEGPEGATAEQLGAFVSQNQPAKAAEPDYSPTNGMSFKEKLLAGAGKAVADLGRGASMRIRDLGPQYEASADFFGLPTRADVEESKKQDAPLMKTGAGMTGNLAGNLAAIVPAGLVAGPSIAGASATGALAGLLQPTTTRGDALTQTALGAGGGAAGQKIANMIGSALTRQGLPSIADQTQQLAKLAAAKSAMAEGYVIPPVDLNAGLATQALSGLSGKIKTSQVASQRNQAVTSRLAREELGVADDSVLTADVLQGIRTQAGQQGYAPIRSAGEITPPPEYFKNLDRLAATNQGASRSFAGLKDNGLAELVETMKQPKFDAGDALDATVVLREMADKSYRAGDKSLGKAQKQIATELENAIDSHLSQAAQPEAVKQFRDARTLIAKTYSVQKALNETTGDVSAQALATQLGKGAPLSGNLLKIAQVGQAFPKATQTLKEAPGSVSPLDYASALIGGLSTGSPLGAVGLVARPAVRSMLLSPAYQRAAVQESTPSLLSHIDPEVLGLLGRPTGITAGLLADR